MKAVVSHIWELRYIRTLQQVIFSEYGTQSTYRVKKIIISFNAVNGVSLWN